MKEADYDRKNLMKKEIEILNPEKILPWIGGPFMSAWILEGVVLIIGFTPNLLFVNYLMEALFLFLFCLSYKNKYKCYKDEPNLKITKYFWIECAIHALFIIGAVVQSAFNVRIGISNSGLNYRHQFFFISIMILTLHCIYMCVDYYVTEKASVVKYCNKIKKEKHTENHK